MKTASLLLLFLLVTINIYSQEGYPEPVTTGKHFLVHSAGLPEEFLPFSPDTASQILFNPARANDFSGNFVFLNYLSDYYYGSGYPVYYPEGYPIVINESGGLKKANGFNFPQIYQESFTNYKNPTFSAVALINTGNAKWLFELTNGINSYNSSLNYQKYNDYLADPATWYYNEKYKTNQENRSDETMTSFKISRIFKADDLNLSAGLYGILLTNNSISDITYFTERYSSKDMTPFDSSSYRDYSLQGEKGNLNEKDTRYVVGLEFTAGTVLFDYIGSIDYQFGDNLYKSDANIDSYAYDSSRYSPSVPWNVSRMEEFRNNWQNSTHNPSVLNLSNYFRYKLGLVLPDDNVFISANAFYASGNISYQDTSERILLTYSETETIGDTLNVNNFGNYDIKDWGVTVSTGYALAKSIDNLYLLTGFRILGSIEHLDGLDRSSVGSSQSGFVENVLKPSLFSITLPVYVNYSPAGWVSVYGGLNYSYIYSSNKSQQSLNVLFRESYSTTKTSSKINYNILNHGWRSLKSIYFGCEFRHSSGLRAQFLFDGDIANVADWNVSLGWVF
jgi:hypothetical protein